MKRVLRYRLEIDGTFQQLGKGKVIYAQPIKINPDAPVQLDIWVEVFVPARWPQTEEEKRTVKVFGTGEPMESQYVHLISVANNREVHHVFDLMMEE